MLAPTVTVSTHYKGTCISTFSADKRVHMCECAHKRTRGEDAHKHTHARGISWYIIT